MLFAVVDHEVTEADALWRFHPERRSKLRDHVRGPFIAALRSVRAMSSRNWQASLLVSRRYPLRIAVACWYAQSPFGSGPLVGNLYWSSQVDADEAWPFVLIITSI